MSGALKKSAFAWTPEALEILSESYSRGDTMQSIANVLSKRFSYISKSAICGKAFRLKLQRHEAFVPNAHGQGAKARKVLAEKRARPKTTDQGIARKARLEALQQINADDVAKQAAPDPVASSADALALAPKGIMVLGHSCCRWPLNITADDGSVLFCGNDRGAARPYCPGHARRAWAKARTPEQAAADAKLRAANVKRAGVNTHGTRRFNTPIEVAA